MHPSSSRTSTKEMLLPRGGGVLLVLLRVSPPTRRHNFLLFSFPAATVARTSVPLPPSLVLLHMPAAVSIGRRNCSPVLLFVADMLQGGLQCMSAAVQQKIQLWWRGKSRMQARDGARRMPQSLHHCWRKREYSPFLFFLIILFIVLEPLLKSVPDSSSCFPQSPLVSPFNPLAEAEPASWLLFGSVKICY